MLLLLIFSVIPSTEAAVIERNWKVAGDGLLTYDNVNHREWLDLTETILADFQNNPDNVVAELSPGGLFEGFAFAKTSDVIALAESAGIDTGTTDFGVNSATTDNLIDQLGLTALSGGGQTRSSFGLVDEFSGASMTLGSRLVAAIEVIPAYELAGLTFVSYGGLTDGPSLITGVMLYRPISEPSTIISLLVAMPFLIVLRSRQRKRR